MELTTRSLWTLIHGMGFGALYLLACSGALVELYRRYSPSRHCAHHAPHDERFLRIYLARHGRACVDHRSHRHIHHLSVVSRRAAARAPRISPHFRSACSCPAPPPAPGTPSAWSGRSTSPGSSPSASPWPRRCLQYGRNLRRHPQLRARGPRFTAVVFLLAAGIAGFFGAMLQQERARQRRLDSSTCAGRKKMSTQARIALRAASASTLPTAPAQQPFSPPASARSSSLSSPSPATIRRPQELSSFSTSPPARSPASPPAPSSLWIVTWTVLHARWRKRTVALAQSTPLPSRFCSLACS